MCVFVLWVSRVFNRTGHAEMMLLGAQGMYAVALAGGPVAVDLLEAYLIGIKHFTQHQFMFTTRTVNVRGSRGSGQARHLACRACVCMCVNVFVRVITPVCIRTGYGVVRMRCWGLSLGCRSERALLRCIPRC